MKNSSNRFAELLARGKAGQLTNQEKKELAHLINEPILPQPIDSALRFVSNYLMTETDMVARLQAIDWFGKCGKLFDFELTMKVEQVTTWAQAIKMLQSESWENAILEARNQLTEFLADHRPERFDQWNTITERFKDEIITPLSTKVWVPFQCRNQLDIALVHNVQWNI